MQNRREIDNAVGFTPVLHDSEPNNRPRGSLARCDRPCSPVMAYRLRMDTLKLCGWSAYQYHRVPPVARAVVDAFLAAGQPLAGIRPDARTGLIGLDRPIRLTVDAPDKRLRSSHHISHLRGSLDEGAFEECGAEGTLVTSPAATLLTLAPSLSHERLALAASEMLGTFAVFRPAPALQSVLDELGNLASGVPDLPHAGQQGIPMQRGSISQLGPSTRYELVSQWRYGGWSQVRDTKGRPTSLWRRNPLVTLADLESYRETSKGLHGSKLLGQALRLAAERCASPLEVRARALLCLPRRSGGECLGTPLSNHPVVLSPAARAIARQGRCYCDLLLAAPRSRRKLDIECQGAVAHDGSERRLSDADRATALSCMGIDVMLLTQRTLANPAACAEFARKARKILGVPELSLSEDLAAKRKRLRREVLVRWEDFGLAR